LVNQDPDLNDSVLFESIFLRINAFVFRKSPVCLRATLWPHTCNASWRQRFPREPVQNGTESVTPFRHAGSHDNGENHWVLRTVQP